MVLTNRFRVARMAPIRVRKAQSVRTVHGRMLVYKPLVCMKALVVFGKRFGNSWVDNFGDRRKEQVLCMESCKAKLVYKEPSAFCMVYRAPWTVCMTVCRPEVSVCIPEVLVHIAAYKVCSRVVSVRMAACKADDKRVETVRMVFCRPADAADDKLEVSFDIPACKALVLVRMASCRLVVLACRAVYRKAVWEDTTFDTA